MLSSDAEVVSISSADGLEAGDSSKKPKTPVQSIFSKGKSDKKRKSKTAKELKDEAEMELLKTVREQF